MGSFNSKFQEDDNCLRIEDLPVEIMCQIFGYFDTNEKMKIAMVNKRWLRIAIMDIKSIAIKWPQERNEDFINFIMRFPRLNNLVLATKITNRNRIRPIESLGFEGTLEFEVSPELIPTKNHFTHISRIKINPAKEEDFELAYDRNQISSFGISMELPRQEVVDEILSLDNVSKIEYECHAIVCVCLASFYLLEPAVNTELCRLCYKQTIVCGKVLSSILSRPYLKQIAFDGAFDSVRFDTQEEFTKNFYVEEIEFDFHFLMPFKLWNKLFDALPNIKKVKIFVGLYEDELKAWNLSDYIKTLSKLKLLKSLHVSIRYGEKLDFGNFPETICEINFPVKSEVVIATGPMDNGQWTNLVEKKEGENPKIVNRRLSQSLFSRYFE